MNRIVTVIVPWEFFLLCCSTGFQLDAAKFFIFMLTVFLTALGAASTAFFVSACAKVTGLANLGVGFLFVIQMVSCAWPLLLMLESSLSLSLFLCFLVPSYLEGS